jgi:hypothetical protein
MLIITGWYGDGDNSAPDDLGVVPLGAPEGNSTADAKKNYERWGVFASFPRFTPLVGGKPC